LAWLGRGEKAIEQAAANFHGSGSVRYAGLSRYVTREVAYVVRVERVETKVGGREELRPVSLLACDCPILA
jgi:hypothetical protein